jgi:transcriptional antiterminator RfaH
MKGWYVVHSKPREERRALANLANQGYPCYLPECVVTKVRRGRRTLVREPLFPRYLFIELDDTLEARSWSPIRSSKGVTGLVAFGGAPVRVEPALIDGLRQQEARHQDEDTAFRPGETVVILDGPFRDLQGVYHQACGEHRAFVLIEFLNRMPRISVALDFLRKAG